MVLSSTASQIILLTLSLLNPLVSSLLIKRIEPNFMRLLLLLFTALSLVSFSGFRNAGNYLAIVKVYESYESATCLSQINFHPEIIVFYPNNEVKKYPLESTSLETRDSNGLILLGVLNDLFNQGYTIKSESSCMDNCISVTEYILD